MSQKIEKLKEQISIMRTELERIGNLYNSDGDIDAGEQDHLNSMMETIAMCEQRLNQAIINNSRSRLPEDIVANESEKNPEYIYDTFGGGTYTVKKGDSLSKIATGVYGNRAYWPLLRDANKDRVRKNGNLILVGAVLNVPSVEIAVACSDQDQSIPDDLNDEYNTSPVELPESKPVIPADGYEGGDGVATEVCNPILRFEMPSTPMLNAVTPLGTAQVTLDGWVQVEDGSPCNIFEFSPTGYKATATQVFDNFKTGWSIKQATNGGATITHSIAGKYSTTKVSVLPNGSLKFTFEAKPVEYKKGKWKAKGTIGISLIITPAPQPLPEPIVVREPVRVRVPEIGKWEAVGLLALAGLTVIVVTIDPIPGDEVPGYAAAASWFGLAVAAF